MIYECAIKNRKTAPHILWPMIWPIGSFRSASSSRQGEQAAHVHSLHENVHQYSHLKKISSGYGCRNHTGSTKPAWYASTKLKQNCKLQALLHSY